MKKTTKSKLKKATRKQYIEIRDKLTEQYERGKISETEFYRELGANFATRLKHYQTQGAQGCIDFVEENVRVLYVPPGKTAKVACYFSDLSDVPDPITGRTWKEFWEFQKEEIIRPALVLKEDGNLKHNLLIFCTERGEGKSLLAVIIQAWKLYCFPDGKIFFCANTKDQSTFAHFSELVKLIMDSPVLLALVGGEKNVKQKEIAIRDGKKRVISFATTVSTYTGVLSNCSGFTFSEFFQSPPDASFFAEIFGSTRNIRNAIGVIDSTVSRRDHKLYKLYEAKQKGEPGTESTFFYYKCNPEGDPALYKSPANTPEQIASFKANFTPQEFGAYFKNTWDDAESNLFTDTEIKASEYIGADGVLLNQKDITFALDEIERHIKTEKQFTDKGLESHGCPELIQKQANRLIPVSRYLSPITTSVNCISANELHELGNLLDTDWAIGVGVDRSDPLAVRSGAQTILTCTAKGLPGSRSNPSLYTADEGKDTKSPKYVYITVGFYHSIVNTADDIQQVIKEWHEEYNGIEGLSSDRYGMADIAGWLIEEEIVKKPEVVHFSAEKQREVFMLLYQAVSKGNYKKPTIGINGVRGVDILTEQFEHFTQSIEGKKMTFGSDEKSKQNGVQDDGIDSLAMGIYSLRFVGLDQFKSVKNEGFFGIMLDSEGRKVS